MRHSTQGLEVTQSCQFWVPYCGRRRMNYREATDG
jgi:hypothetical protein